MHLNAFARRVALKGKGAGDMAELTLNLPDDDSPKGVSLPTLEAYVKARGSQSTEEFVNLVIADALGYRATPTEPVFQGLADLRDQLNNGPTQT